MLIMVVDNFGMIGSIPTELKELHDLKFLDLSSNGLSGEVPPELSLLTKLGASNHFYYFFLSSLSLSTNSLITFFYFCLR